MYEVAFGTYIHTIVMIIVHAKLQKVAFSGVHFPLLQSEGVARLDLELAPPIPDKLAQLEALVAMTSDVSGISLAPLWPQSGTILPLCMCIYCCINMTQKMYLSTILLYVSMIL